jgi:hypothetical protein
MDVSSRSVIDRLFAVQGSPSFEVARLWARADNEASESAVSHALGRRLDTLKRSLAPGRTARARKEQLLSKMMAMSCPGVGILLWEGWYLLLPGDSRRLIAPRRAHPFGVVANTMEFQLFVDSADLPPAADALNKILAAYMARFPRGKVIVHALYQGVPPRHGQDLLQSWPLKIIPSLVCHWHQARYGLGALDRAVFFTPHNSMVDGEVDLTGCANWAKWQAKCELVRGFLEDHRLRPGRVLTDAESARRRYADGAEHGRYANSAKGGGRVKVGTLTLAAMVSSAGETPEPRNPWSIPFHYVPLEDYKGPRWPVKPALPVKTYPNSVGMEEVAHGDGEVDPLGFLLAMGIVDMIEARSVFKMSQQDLGWARQVDDELCDRMAGLLPPLDGIPPALMDGFPSIT